MVSDRLSTAVAPHQDSHDERPHRQEEDAHQFDDRWNKALLGHHNRALVHERGSGNRGHTSHPARVDGSQRDSHSEQE